MKEIKRYQSSHKNEKFECCLPSIESILPKLAQLLEAPYTPGDYDRCQRDFDKSDQQKSQWTLIGDNVAFSVTLEKYEGYLFVSLEGSGPLYESGKKYLYQCYLSQGANPEAQQEP